ncbi:Mu-like prophage major head subunit gpT family protein [Desulfovibrio inopinatus]|uniref:Mu-like prophage major head subunit gpT family protein n=1 Tax=Desulfovibrio inopinatus TaxID=102109 RepID=UPI000401A0C3|nr:Mu-like prophage major head subunit gpT family protein [Desulfovibrio inopinatus]
MLVNKANLAAVYRGLKTEFQAALRGVPSDYETIADILPSTTAIEDYTWISDFPALREWIGDKIIKQLSGFKYTVVNKDFESTIAVKRNDLEDDRIGAYGLKAKATGRAAGAWPNRLIFGLLSKGWTTACYDGKAFFATDHSIAGKACSNSGGGTGTAWYLLDTTQALKPLIMQLRKKPQMVVQDDPQTDSVFKRGEYLVSVEARGNAGFGLWQCAYGSKQTLDPAAFAAARAAMMSQTDDNGDPLGISPNVLVVPPTLEENALEILKAEKLADNTSNIWRGMAEPLVSPWLSAAA